MTRRSITRSLLVTALVLVFCAAPIWAAVPTASVTFDQANQSVKVSIAGGDDTIYVAHVSGSGCIDTTMQSVNLQGPADSDSVTIFCTDSSSSGQVEIAFCKGEACFDTKYLTVICGSNCVISEAGHVPALSEWGLILLILLIAASAIWVIRRRRVPA
jgi:hypothetical protein